MSGTDDEVRTATAALTEAMAALVRALDARGGDAEAAGLVPDSVPDALHELANRLEAVQTLGGA